MQWPSGTYTLMQPRQGCPPGWSSGWRYQDNEDSRNANRWSPSNIASYLRFDTGTNFGTHYCTKTHGTADNGFSWPQGRYCIARYGGRCPDRFIVGSLTWDDEDSRNANRMQRPVPDGWYNSNTKSEYCCRSDGNPYTEVFLPPTQPFVLYRYQGVCQRVRGMTVRQFFIHFDDEDSRNNNRCEGNHPDGPCGSNHELHPCYYAPA